VGLLKTKDLISVKDLRKEEIEEVFRLSFQMKRDKSFSEPLKGKSIALIFQKPSNRTRVSFEVGMYQLGGHAVYLGPEEIKLGVRESAADVARVLSRYIDGIVARTFKHEDIVNLAKSSTIPVINGLSDLLHPCQALSDIFTIKEQLGNLSLLRLVYIGDGNNVLHSLMHGAGITGLNMTIVNPRGYGPNADIVKEALFYAKKSGSIMTFTDDPLKAVKDADVIYTDVWTSMGQEKERNKRLKVFKRFRVDEALLVKAKKGCRIMHCLPAHRGEEITDDVLDGPSSIVFDQAENRLHVQKALLYLLLKN